MFFPVGSTSNSTIIQIVNDSGIEVTGLVASTFPTIEYAIAGPNAAVGITPVDLTLITSPYGAGSGVGGGVKELAFGYYRLDLPDAIFANQGLARILGGVSGKHVICPEIIVMNLVRSNDLATLSQISGQVLRGDQLQEPAQGIPPTTPTFEQAFMYLFMKLVRQVTFDKTDNFEKLFNNAGVVISKTLVNDDGTTLTRHPAVSGP
jgi:hypothetical protein